MNKITSFVSVFLIGVIIGGSIVNVANGIVIEKISFERDAYKLNNAALNEKIEKLNESLKNQSYRVVTDIKPYVSNSDSKIRIEVEKYINEKLKDIYGKQVEKINPDLIFNIFEGRILSIENKKVSLKVKYIVINTTLEIYVTAQTKE
ncbi:hypothetical protein BFT35_02320 [Thermoanaerobacterium thermosaccharolyticum]|uniref:Sporulation membrane protein YtrI C-terminal domain-containing protein n=2 Tax=Thermoanaerobacterium thermosaccharolyticum TaxID=1517 RepID=D9TTL1_THETC|nr:hypothetical protein [Thermoanaerobacterium thermosaccharolyticum]ADL68268.1 conserved hypothetical protein [Thermoanaerobacterium thermosaccharolyticum DSM 571]AGB18382.1 THUMP domain protein [Thermoanaerobacterium thermosaccharolyticum M0795]PHO08307.1 hypothetical protein BFT35_02320 [Thermoanaerobacterium thermosaccharolyticum]